MSLDHAVKTETVMIGGEWFPRQQTLIDMFRARIAALETLL